MSQATRVHQEQGAKDADLYLQSSVLECLLSLAAEDFCFKACRDIKMY